MIEMKSCDFENVKNYANEIEELLKKKNVFGSEESDYIEFPNICYLCLKVMNMYATGVCNHPVCLECSVRMRVLNNKFLCAICQTYLSRVICASTKLPFSKLEINFHRQNLCYGICGMGFYNIAVEREFSHLMENSCCYCEVLPFHHISFLEKHLYEAHNSLRCVLCVSNLKKFPFEYEAYTKANLKQHLLNNHPRCKFCATFYFDETALYVHMRNEYHRCHICIEENEFYFNFLELEKHFSKKHFLCIFEKCAQNRFTNCFAKKCDYETHLLEVHNILLNKTKDKLCDTEVALIFKQRRSNSSLQANESSNEESAASFASSASNLNSENSIQSQICTLATFSSNSSVEVKIKPLFKSFVITKSGEAEDSPLSTTSSTTTDEVDKRQNSSYSVHSQTSHNGGMLKNTKCFQRKNLGERTENSNKEPNIVFNNKNNCKQNTVISNNIFGPHSNSNSSTSLSDTSTEFRDDISNSSKGNDYNILTFPEFPPWNIQNFLDKETQTDKEYSPICSNFLFQNKFWKSSEHVRNNRQSFAKFTEIDFPSLK